MKGENNMDNDYIIINNTDFFSFIYKFNSDGLVDANIKNMILNDSNFNDEYYISYFNMDEYINDIKKSYDNKDENIMEQFKRDYNRQNIRLNGYKYENYKLFLGEMGKIQGLDKNFGILKMTHELLIILLCCQSSFYLPYQILVNLYGINSENRALICNSKNLMGIYIDIIVDDKKIIIELNNILFIRDIDKNINTHKINTKITIDVNIEINDENKLYNEPNICVFNWKITRI